MIHDTHLFDRGSGLLPMMAALPSVAVLVMTMLPVSFAQAVLQPGQDAPPLDLKESSGIVYHLDEKTSEPVLLVFARSQERYTTASLQALNDIFDKHPKLEQGLKRWVIFSGGDAAQGIEHIRSIAGQRWAIMLDPKNEMYQKYKIVATPTVVLVGQDRRIKAVNPGYDLGMENNVQNALAQVLSVSLPEALLKQPPKPNMMLQMGRRMAARGLWERAVEYYGKAMEHGPLSVDAQLELAQIYLEMERPDEAMRILNQIPSDSPAMARAEPLLKRARALKEKASETPQPPKIIR